MNDTPGRQPRRYLPNPQRVGVGDCLNCGRMLIPSGGYQYLCPTCRKNKRNHKKLAKAQRHLAAQQRTGRVPLLTRREDA